MAPWCASIPWDCADREGALFVDESHRDLLLSTVDGGPVRPLSSMPGELVGPVYRGPMEAETRHFIDCISLGSPTLVLGEQARLTMEVVLAADLSAEGGAPVAIPRRPHGLRSPPGAPE